MEPYQYTSSNGTTYYLHGRYVRLNGGVKRFNWYFARKVNDEFWQPKVPPWMEVVENPRNGFPLLKEAA